MEETERDYSKPDPWKVFSTLAKIIGEREGLEITLVGVERIDSEETA